MYVDVVDVLRLHFRIFESGLHHEVCAEAFGVRRRDVVSISRHTDTCYFAVDLCTASLGVLEFLEDEDTGTFTHDETVAACAEGTGSVGGVVVASGEGVHGVETAYAAGPDGSFCTTSDDGISLTQADEVEGVGESVG